MFKDQTVLITGGTGSFGKKLARHLLKHSPEVKKIIIFSRDEFKQFSMANESPFKEERSRLRFFIGDVRDKERLQMAMDGVDYLVHAAALKQVPACEYNPFEAVKTNIIGAQNIIDAALKCNLKKVIALSTDKACSPVNLYGATKLCSDKLFIAANGYAGKKQTIFSVVRYGNVAGSRGSVIPFFQQLLKHGCKELPITDFRMTRFWLKLESAVWLVMHALESMLGGEMYIKKIPSMRITDLAEAIAPGMPLKECGIRPGEKIHEQMISEEDARNTVEFPDYYIIQPQAEWWEKRKPACGGQEVKPGFSYNSGSNPQWLTVEEMREMLEDLDADV